VSVQLSDRFFATSAKRIEESLELGRGDIGDYLSLSEHHYRSDRPATVTRVLVLRSARLTASDRYLGRGDRRQVVGVLVESMPTLCGKLRDWALADRYKHLGNARLRGRALSPEMRCISRVVIDPQWRGLGLAVRLVSAALAEPQTIYTEALAAMGHVHPFFERAGMTAYRRPPHRFDARLRDALLTVGLEVTDLAMLSASIRRIEALEPATRRWFVGELQRWYRASCRGKVNRTVGVIDSLRAARGRLLCQPVYYLKDNR